MDNSTPKNKFVSTGFIVGLLVIFAVACFANWFPRWWPPVSVERREQRAKITERVQSVGGWDTVRRGCASLAAQHTDGYYMSRFHDTNLPPAIMVLEPMFVEYDPKFGCVGIKIFGMYSTGGHCKPYFGLEIDTSSNSLSYKHGTGYDNGGVTGNHHSVAQQIAEGVYEIY